MNRIYLRELRIRLELDSDTHPCVVPLLETLEDLLEKAEDDDTDELVSTLGELIDNAKSHEAEIAMLEKERDRALAKLKPPTPPTPTPPLVPPTPPSSSGPKRGVLRLVPDDRPKSEGNVIPIELRQNNGEAAYALYVRACEIDERPDTYDIAETLYRRAVHLDPTLAIAWTNLGNVRYRRGDTEGALQIWQRALQIQPNQIEAIINMGIAIDDALEDAEAAVPWYERVLSLDAKYIDAHVRLAQCLDEMGQADRARRHWRRSLELEPHGHYARAARLALGLQRVK